MRSDIAYTRTKYAKCEDSSVQSLQESLSYQSLHVGQSDVELAVLRQVDRSVQFVNFVPPSHVTFLTRTPFGCRQHPSTL